MGGKAKASQRRAYEARAATKGAGMITVRLSPGANRMLRAICTQYDCCPRDVVEGLLLGNVRPVVEKPLGLSGPEIEYVKMLELSSDRWGPQG